MKTIIPVALLCCVLTGCGEKNSITIPDGVTEIKENAFRDFTSLESVTIPSSVKKIGKHAFSGCKSLNSVTIPDGVTEIGGGAFPPTAKIMRE